MKRGTVIASLLSVLSLWATTAGAQRGASETSWTSHAGDKGATHYSPAAQVDASNVARLELAWRWSAPDNELGITQRIKLPNSNKSTPLFEGGVIYTSTPYGMAVAIDPVTGKTRWKYDPEVWKGRRPGNLGFNHKGVAYWSNGEHARILLGTNTAYVHSLDALTGEPVGAFAESGVLDLVPHYRRPIKRRDLMLNSPVLIAGDLIIQSGSINDRPNNKEMAPGDVHAFDVETGELVWTFHNPPLEGEPGYETWEEGSADYTGNTNVWTHMSYDEELGLLYLPFGTPTNDFYGGQRKGKNLFAESLVCLEAKTGKLIWYFQSTHHGVWDWDLPAPPNLVDVTVDGKKVQAVAQVAKQGFVWVLDRRTGEPVWPIEERPVPQTTVPGEETWPTQPFPTKPAPFSYSGSEPDLLIDFTPELRKEAMAILEQYNYGPIYTPPLLAEANKDTLVNPGWGGSANWSGGAFDPESGVLYVPSVNHRVSTYSLGKPDPARSNLDYVGQLGRGPAGPRGLPLFKPPYAHVTAIDLNIGHHLWEVPIGDGPIDHPAIANLELEPLGSFDRNFHLVTKTLLFLAGSAGSDESGERETNFRALDKATGETVWETTLPATLSGNPMTFVHEGRQWILVPAGGRGEPSELLALTLPASTDN
ncbi:MAG: PQQ-binding-like beta-propeller repeat protein [Acidobacteriota bacterium]